MRPGPRGLIDRRKFLRTVAAGAATAAFLGGDPQSDAKASEDSWRRTLALLQSRLKR